MHFLTSSTLKSVPIKVRFPHFDFEMCFAPQQGALFQHLNFQKNSKHGVFCTFWLRHVLQATMASTFSTCQLPGAAVSLAFSLPNLLRATTAWFFWSPIPANGSAPATLARLLRPSGAPKTLEKHNVSRRFYLFGAPWSSFYWLFLFSDLLSFSLLFSDLLSSHSFSSLTVPTSAASSVHIIGSLTSILNFLRWCYGFDMIWPSTNKNVWGLTNKHRIMLSMLSYCKHQMGVSENGVYGIPQFMAISHRGNDENPMELEVPSWTDCISTCT